MARKTSPRRGPATPKSKKLTKNQEKPGESPESKPTPKLAARESKAAKTSRRRTASPRTPRQSDIVAIVSSRRAVGPLTPSQIQSNLVNRLKRDVPEDSVLTVLDTLETRGKLARSYSLSGPPPKQRKRATPSRTPRSHSAGMGMKDAIADEASVAPAQDHRDDFDLQCGVRRVMCRPPGPLSASEIKNRVTTEFGMDFSLDEIRSAIDGLIAGGKAQRAADGRFTCKCT